MPQHTPDVVGMPDDWIRELLKRLKNSREFKIAEAEAARVLNPHIEAATRQLHITDEMLRTRITS